MADWGINPQFIGGRPARPEWMNPKGLEQPWLDPVELLAGVGGAARIVGKKALAGLVPDILGGVAAESVADRESTWAPLAANVAANIVAGKMLDPARLAELRELAPRVLNNERGMFTPPTAEDMQRLARMAAGEDVEAPRVFSALHDRMPRVEIDDSGASLIPMWERKVEDAARDSKFVNGRWEKRKMTAAEIFPHQKLYVTVPGLSETGIKTGRNMDNLGAYDPQTGDISLYRNDVSGTLPNETLLHELQHAVQERGGFARGGSPFEKGLPTAIDIAQNINKKYADDLQRLAKENKWDEYALLDDKRRVEVDSIFEQDKNGGDIGGLIGYRRLAGEIEARDTAARMNLSDIARASTQPYSGYAVRPDGSFGPTYEPNPIRLEDFIVRR